MADRAPLPVGSDDGNLTNHGEMLGEGKNPGGLNPIVVGYKNPQAYLAEGKTIKSWKSWIANRADAPDLGEFRR